MSPANVNVVAYDMREHAVHAVTIYQTNYAQVTRKVKCSLKSGRNEIEIDNLSMSVMRDTIRVECDGAIVSDLILEPIQPYRYNPHVVSEDERRRSAVADELKVLTDQNEILNTFNKSDGIKDLMTDDLMDYIDAYGAQRQQLNEQKQKLQCENERLNNRISAAYYTENSDNVGGLTPTNSRVIFVLMSEQNSDVEVTFSYMVCGTSWVPQYEVNSIVARDFKSQSLVVLKFRASIQQQTGEDWTDVAISLSTGTPCVVGSVVSLQSPYAYSYPPMPAPVPPPPCMFSSDVDASRPPSIINEPISPSPIPCPPMPPLVSTYPSPYISLYQSGRQTGEIINVPGLTSIKSQFMRNHIVHICEQTYDPVKLRYVTEPSKKQEVWLECALKNTTPYKFPEGEMRVYMNDNFIMKSKLDTVIPGDDFTCSFGTQSDIKVTYHPKDYTYRTKRKFLIGRLRSTSTEKQRITIKNLTQNRIENLIVKEWIPVESSYYAKNSYKTIEPKELSTDSNAAGRGNAVAHWTETDEDFKDKINGKHLRSLHLCRAMEWICSVQPKAKIELAIAYEISS